MTDTDQSAMWCMACRGTGPRQCEDPTTCGSPMAHRIRRQFSEKNTAEQILKRWAESDEYTDLSGRQKFQITAGELHEGDRWLGETDDTYMIVGPVFTQQHTELRVPWNAGRVAEPIWLDVIRFEGTMFLNGVKQFQGFYSLQADQPIEVLR